MAKESKDMFFVEVRDPNEVRRNILESMKGIIESLQRFEKFKVMRKDKIDKINGLRKTVKELNKLTSNLKGSLPESNLRLRASKSPEKKKTSKDKHKAEGKKESETEIQKLESQLSQIEGKLTGLR
ncbi:hypothetical protein CL615_03110 [archaeon]|jgi:hypothetical protein|nr:hypothetical protein [archaeon]MDP6548284.1 hypothetical protein [Candidatus Woesearchaeota archaeon]|tara:strand:+ start:21946 stop:22323 length:378 start_codon:yes stop_codon:yes gene_type:complete